MPDYSIPAKILNKIRFNNIVMVMGGSILLVGLFFFKIVILPTLVQESDIALFANMFNVAIILDAIFLLIIPLFMLAFHVSEKEIEKTMKKNNITYKILDFDFDHTKKIGKIQVGNVCTYSSSFYKYSILPNDMIAWVYKEQKTDKQTKVARNVDGSVKYDKYTMAENSRYIITLKTLDNKRVTVNCSKNTTANDILAHYSNLPNVLIGLGKEQRKAYNQMVKEYKSGIKQQEKEFDPDEPNIRL